MNLLAERFDVALRVGPLVDSTLVRSRVGAYQSVVVASPSYVARAGLPENPRDLSRHNCIRYSNVTAAREWRFRGRRGEVSIPVIGNLAVNHGGAMRAAAVAGLGVAKLPDFMVGDALRGSELVRLLEEYELPPTGIHIVYPSGATALPKLEVFVAEIGAALKGRLAMFRGRGLRPSQ